MANPCWVGGGRLEKQWLSKLLLSWYKENEVAAAQQILAQLVEEVFSRLVLSRVTQTQTLC